MTETLTLRSDVARGRYESTCWSLATLTSFAGGSLDSATFFRRIVAALTKGSSFESKLYRPGILQQESHANLLVVFLLVELYKLGSARSSKILPSARGKDSHIAKKQEAESRRHDLFRFFGSTLAADRGGETDYRYHLAQDLRSFPLTSRSPPARIGQRDLRAVGLKPVILPNCGE